jgi:hypothetical protein
MISKFLALLAAASEVSVDEGDQTKTWTLSNVIGESDNQIVHISWKDAVYDYSVVLTEGGIANGTFENGGEFLCEDMYGDETKIRFFESTRNIPNSESKEVMLALLNDVADVMEAFVAHGDVSPEQFTNWVYKCRKATGNLPVNA